MSVLGSRHVVAAASKGPQCLNRAHLRSAGCWHRPGSRALHSPAPNNINSAAVSRKQPRVCEALPRDDSFGYGVSAYEQVITFLTADGKIVRIPGSSTTQAAPASSRRQYPRMPTWDEQKLCIGASFVLAATNGHNPSRRINLEGFCQSVDYLFDSIEDTVRSTRGEILVEERELKSGVHEVLKVTVAIPFLWGVPPQLERLSTAINSGGGVVHRMYHQWVVL